VINLLSLQTNKDFSEEELRDQKPNILAYTQKVNSTQYKRLDISSNPKTA